MQKTIKVEFDEQSKAVTSNIKIEYLLSNENINNDDVLREAKELFEKAQQYSIRKTLEKMR